MDTITGVPITRNVEPVHPEGALALEAVWQQRGSETDEALWEEPRFLAAGAESIFLLDPLARRVYRLDASTGQVILSFGRAGPGPGEFERPTALVASDSLVGVLDRNMLDWFHHDGSLAGNPSRLGAAVFSMQGLGDGYLLSAFGLGAPLAVFDGDTILPLTPPEPRAAPADAGFESCRRYRALGEHPVVMSCQIPYVRVFDVTGAPRREILIARPAQDRSPEAIERAYERQVAALGGAGQMTPEMAADMATWREGARVRRPFSLIRQDPSSGQIALLEQDEEGFPGPSHLHVFDREGRYLARVGPLDRWWDFTFYQGDLVVLTRDGQTGLVEAVRYRWDGPVP